MDTDEILSQMGVTQWRLRDVDRFSSTPAAKVRSEPIVEPIMDSVANSTAEVETVTRSVEVVESFGLELEKPEEQHESVIRDAGFSEEITVQLRQLSGNQSSVLANMNWLVVYVADSDVLAVESQHTLLSNIISAVGLIENTDERVLKPTELMASMADLNADLVLVFGESVGAVLLPHKQELPTLKVVPQQLGASILPALVLPSLQHLLASPIEKREVWEALKQAIALSQ